MQFWLHSSVCIICHMHSILLYNYPAQRPFFFLIVYICLLTSVILVSAMCFENGIYYDPLNILFTWGNSIWCTSLHVSFVLFTHWCCSFFLIRISFSLHVQGGVQRVHIIDGTVGGSLLLELFTRDGAGTLIARYIETLDAFHIPWNISLDV